MSEKNSIAQHYREVALKAAVSAQDSQSSESAHAQNRQECCFCAETGSEAGSLYSEEVLRGIPAETLAASRGCGDPVAIAHLEPGERVLDLGSGGGIDALIAARLVGDSGSVFGLDMVPEMVQLARRSAQQAGIGNVAFIEGDITEIPLQTGSVDVVISNCVINLCDDKAAVFREARRVLAPGGRMVVSDIVAFKPLPVDAVEALCAITGCRNGIPDADFYRRMICSCGFDNVSLDGKTLYTLDVLEEKATRKHREKHLSAVRSCNAGGLTGSVIVRASVARR